MTLSVTKLPHHLRKFLALTDMRLQSAATVRYPLRLHKALCWDPGYSAIPLGSWQSTDLGSKCSLKTIAMDPWAIEIVEMLFLAFFFNCFRRCWTTAWEAIRRHSDRP